MLLTGLAMTMATAEASTIEASVAAAPRSLQLQPSEANKAALPVAADELSGAAARPTHSSSPLFSMSSPTTCKPMLTMAANALPDQVIPLPNASAAPVIPLQASLLLQPQQASRLAQQTAATNLFQPQVLTGTCTADSTSDRAFPEAKSLLRSQSHCLLGLTSQGSAANMPVARAPCSAPTQPAQTTPTPMPCPEPSASASPTNEMIRVFTVRSNRNDDGYRSASCTIPFCFVI